MRSDWKRILYLLILFTFFNCAWVIRTREEVNRPSLKLDPLPESLVVLPDSSSDDYKYIVVFQTRWRFTSYQATQPILTYAVRADGKFEVTYHGHSGFEEIDLGYLDRSEIQHLVDTLNNLGFLRIGKAGLFYEHFDVEKIYLFGLLIKTKRQVIQNYPSDVTYHFVFRLKTLIHQGNYCGIEGVTERPEYIKELQVLKCGSELIEKYFEEKALEFSDRSYSLSGLLEHQIVPVCSLDEKIKLANKIFPHASLSAHKHRKKGESYRVVIKMLVAPDGHVVCGLIEEPSGYRYYDYRVLYLIKSYRFTCPKYRGNPAYTWVSLPVQSLVCE